TKPKQFIVQRIDESLVHPTSFVVPKFSGPSTRRWFGQEPTPPQLQDLGCGVKRFSDRLQIDFGLLPTQLRFVRLAFAHVCPDWNRLRETTPGPAPSVVHPTRSIASAALAPSSSA